MRRCLIILPYFGKFPSYFPLFLKSVEKNPGYNWLIVTDDTRPFAWPENVTVCYQGFAALRERIQSFFDFPVTLPEPYKLCDFRPAYGMIFAEELREYEYWGYGDCDLLFGNLERLLTPLLEKGYDKVFAAGHLTLYRNTPENNARFLKDYKGKPLYRRAFTDPGTCCFDEDYLEENIHRIFLADGARVYAKDRSLNLAMGYSQFRLIPYVEAEGGFRLQPFRRGLYVWDDGELSVIREGKDGTLAAHPYLYIHFQSRDMRWREGLERESRIWIYPNGFKRLAGYPATLRQWRRMTRYSFTTYYFRQKWRGWKRKSAEFKKALRQSREGKKTQ